jgi:pimeloyl-ACP methyl ester carboxylesterase/DNA-binding CsgD family transcriptional regulator
MTGLRQRVRFCRTPSGVRLAHSTIGEGRPLVVVAGWVSHLELDLECPVRRHWYEALAAEWSLSRFDSRGFGLSDRDVGAQSLDSIVEDLATVVDHAELGRFALLGLLDGGAAALAYAQRYPDRVSQLILHSGYVRGMLHRDSGSEADGITRALIDQVERGWDSDHPLAREIFLSGKCPEALPQERDQFIALARQSATGRDAAQRMRALVEINIPEVAARISCPTLVTHAKGDKAPPFAEGRLMASLIPEARFVPLAGRSNIIHRAEPAWPQWLAEVRRFVRQPSPDGRQFPSLSPREAELAMLVAQGLDNSQIAAHLAISEKTVRNHMTSIFAKLRVESRAQAIVLVREGGFRPTLQ